MKTGKVWVAFLVLFFLLAALVACSPKETEEGTVEEGAAEEAVEAIELRLVMGTPAGDERTVWNEEMAENFNARAGGRYVLKVHPGGTLVNVPEYLDAVRTGAVELFDSALPAYAGQDPRFNAFVLPYLFDSGEAFIAAEKDLVELFSSIMEEKFNQKILGFAYVGSFDIFNTKRTVKSPEDLKGMLVGAPDPGIAAILDQLGAATVNVAWPDFYTSLDKGVVDGIMFMPNAVINNKLTDLCKYYTSINNPQGHAALSINLDVWNAMPEDIQQILVEEIQKSYQKVSEHYINQREKDHETMRGLGVEVYLPTEAEQEQFKALCIDYTEQELDNYGDVGAKLREIREKANNQVR
jgi:TRAP-type C4-dicarboxylate transport system substrate-binding protein